jgi:hypothetical protein
VLVLAALLATAVAPGAARAASPPAPAAVAARVVPTSLPPSVAIGSSFHVGLRIAGDEAEYVRFTIHEPIASILRFESTTRGDDLGEVIDEPVKLHLSTLAPAPGGVSIATIALLARGQQLADTASSLRVMHVPGPGVYPLEITLVGARDTDDLDHVVTWLVATNGPAAHPLRVAWVWTLAAAPLRNAAGTLDPRTLDATRPGGRLDSITQTMAAMAAIPTTVRLTPELAQSWQALAENDHPELRAGMMRLGDDVARAQILNAPFVDVDRPAFAAAGFNDLLQNQMLTGRDALQSTLGVHIDPSTAFVDALDGPSLPPLVAAFTDRLVVRPTSLSGIDSSLRYRSFGIAGTALTAAQTDDDLLAFLAGPESPVLRAQRLLAVLSLVASAAPDATRGVVLAPDANPIDTSTARLVARGLTNNPWLVPVRLDQWFASVEPARDASGAPIARTVVGASASAVAVTRTRYDAAERDLADLRELVGTHDAHVTRAERALLVVVARETSADVAAAALDAIPAAAHNFLSGITTTPRTVTLTARRSRIPLSFTNTTGRHVTIRVTLDSDKLLATNGSVRVDQIVSLPARPIHTTVLFPVETRASGKFPVDVVVTSRDGAVEGNAPVTITVDSTVFGSFGSWLTYGALAFLALWWGHHIFKTRRGRRTAA